MVHKDMLHINVGLSESGSTRTLKFVVPNESVDLFRLMPKLSPLVISAKIGRSHVDKNVAAVMLSDRDWSSTDLSQFITKMNDTISAGLGYKADQVIVYYEKAVRTFILEMEKKERSAVLHPVNPNDIKPKRPNLRLL